MAQGLATMLFVVMGTFDHTYALPAAAATCYTLATVNNSFEHNLNALIGSVDSHGMSLLLSLFFLSTLFHLPVGIMSFFALLTVTTPFIMDGAISLVNITHS